MVDVATNEAAWDPVRLTYARDGDEVELPFKLMVLGPLGGRRVAEGVREATTPVGPEGVDAALADYGLHLELTVEDCVARREGGRTVEVAPRALRDFEPDRLVENVPILAGTWALIQRLREGGTTEPETQLEEEVCAALDCWPQTSHPDARDYAVAELSDRLGRQIDEILHHSQFQRVEGAWRGVALLAAKVGEAQNTRLDILDIDRERLLEDFREAAALDQSLFFQAVYAGEFGQYGGEPYGAVVGAFEFGRSSEDRELLTYIGSVCARAHAPFIAGASPQLLGLERFAELVDASALGDLWGSPAWAKWRSLASEPMSRYLGLTLPRILLRSPYGPAQEGRRPATGPIWGYREHIGRDHEHRLWGVGAFGFAVCLLRSFARYGICVDITGTTGGGIDGLPPIDERASTGRTQPVEVMLSEQKEAELAQLGLIPVSVARAHRHIGFNVANSLHWAAEEVAGSRSDLATMGNRFGAQLPYLFLISRIAHYLKVIQRDLIGTMRTEAELQSELDTWLRRYVSDVDQPAPELRARRPLRHAQLTVTDELGDGSSYRMNLEVVPHAKIMNSEIVLDLQGTLGQEQPST